MSKLEKEWCCVWLQAAASLSIPVLKVAVLSARLVFELLEARVEMELLKLSIEVPKIGHLNQIAVSWLTTNDGGEIGGEGRRIGMIEEGGEEGIGVVDVVGMTGDGGGKGL